MKKHLNVNRTIIAICLLFSVVSCSSYYSKNDVTREVLDSFTSFASESDTAAIQSITLHYTDKRFYAKFEHSAIDVTYKLSVRNSSSNVITFRISDSLGYATYQRDQVGWLSDWLIDDPEKFQILPGQSDTIFISNTGFFGGAFYWWEDLFPKKDDYTLDMLKILPDIKVHYNGQIVLPSRDVTITVVNYKDEWYYRKIHHLLGTPYSFDTQLR